ncbi:MAG TPA: glycosyltransferase family 39 protein, partial [Phototrophicaceae bacterium]|nr:glycosyltransferase family 39 protein [Phototrophicaceae bacterium]
MKRLWPILAALIFAAALRIIGAGGYPVWTDEGWSIWASSDPTQVVGIVAADRHPPLYFAALSVWRLAAGDTHITLRFLSIAAGLLLVALVYRLAADVFGRRAGLFAALLFAALPIA